jgi:hypothetical protein
VQDEPTLKQAEIDSFKDFIHLPDSGITTTQGVLKCADTLMSYISPHSMHQNNQTLQPQQSP